MRAWIEDVLRVLRYTLFFFVVISAQDKQKMQPPTKHERDGNLTSSISFMRALDDWRLPLLSWKLTEALPLALEDVLPETLCPVDSRVRAGTTGSGAAG